MLIVVGGGGDGPAEEIEERVDKLEAAGYEVDADLKGGSVLLRQLGEKPPVAIVIDLSRMPSQGRDLAIMIRKRKSTRHIPLAFVAGEPEKVTAIKELLPDAIYTSWDEIGSGIEQAVATAPDEPSSP